MRSAFRDFLRPRFRDACAGFEQPTSLRVTVASLNFVAAEPLYRKALEIRRRTQGEAHPDSLPRACTTVLVCPIRMISWTCRASIGSVIA